MLDGWKTPLQRCLPRLQQLYQTRAPPILPEFETQTVDQKHSEQEQPTNALHQTTSLQISSSSTSSFFTPPPLPMLTFSSPSSAPLSILSGAFLRAVRIARGLLLGVSASRPSPSPESSEVRLAGVFFALVGDLAEP